MPVELTYRCLLSAVRPDEASCEREAAAHSASVRAAAILTF
jgi:hypothetical protein